MTSKVINMWSGPRNISTAIMYSFAQRSDCKVVDEPFYAHYLLQSGAKHPGRAKVLESQPKDPSMVMQNLVASQKQSDILFIKNMAHHMIEMKETLAEIFSSFIPLFLIRNPRDMLLSLDQTLPEISMQDTGYRTLLNLFESTKSRELPLLVLDSKELLEDPEWVLTKLCKKLDIPFEPSMLEWPMGPLPEDGVWAEYWYKSVHQSTGFLPYTPKNNTLPDRLKPLHRDCKAIYDQLFAHAIKK